LRSFDYSWRFKYGIVFGDSSDARMTISASCNSNNPGLCTISLPNFNTLKTGATTPFGNVNLCETNGLVQTYTYGTPTATYPIFVNGAFATNWIADVPASPTVQPCKIQNGTSQTNGPALVCNLFDLAGSSVYAGWTAIYRNNYGVTNSITGMTHLAIDIRSAPSYGQMDITVGIFDPTWDAQLIALSQPQYSDFGVDETWRTLYIPLGDFGVNPSTFNPWGVAITRGDNTYARPVRVYLNNIRYVTVTATPRVVTFPTIPAAPIFINGPGRFTGNPEDRFAETFGTDSNTNQFPTTSAGDNTDASGAENVGVMMIVVLGMLVLSIAF